MQPLMSNVIWRHNEASWVGSRGSGFLCLFRSAEWWFEIGLTGPVSSASASGPSVSPRTSWLCKQVNNANIQALIQPLLSQKLWRWSLVASVDSEASLGFETGWSSIMAFSSAKGRQTYLFWKAKKPFVFAVWLINLTLQADLLPLIFLRSIACNNHRLLWSSWNTSNRFIALWCKMHKSKNKTEASTPLIIPLSWQIKRKKRKGGQKRMFFNFVYSWKPESVLTSNRGCSLERVLYSRVGRLICFHLPLFSCSVTSTRTKMQL